jgi:hypothetical protein
MHKQAIRARFSVVREGSRDISEGRSSRLDDGMIMMMMRYLDSKFRRESANRPLIVPMRSIMRGNCRRQRILGGALSLRRCAAPARLSQLPRPAASCAADMCCAGVMCPSPGVLLNEQAGACCMKLDDSAAAALRQALRVNPSTPLHACTAATAATAAAGVAVDRPLFVPSLPLC